MEQAEPHPLAHSPSRLCPELAAPKSYSVQGRLSGQPLWPGTRAAPGGRLRVLKHVLAPGCGVTPGTAERATSLKPGHWSEVRCRCVAGQGSEIPEHTRQEEQAGNGCVAPVMQTTHCAGVEKLWPENQDIISKVKPKASAPLLCVELRAASLMW